MKKLAKITENLCGQPMFDMLAKMQQKEENGEKVYHLEIGDSDFPTSPHIRDTIKSALDNEEYHYCDSTGTVEFKRAIQKDTEKRLGFRPLLNQIVVMPSNAIIDFVLRVICNEGDEVIYTDPGFSTYIAVTSYTGIKGIGVPIYANHKFHITANDIENKITEKTKLIIINSPHNPTGAVLTKTEIMEIALLAKKYDLYILSDEIYSRIVYGVNHHSPSYIDHCAERTIILEGFAKAYAMPGMRLGYAIAPLLVAEKLGKLFQTIYSCYPPFIQAGGIAALRNDSDGLKQRVRIYKVLRDLVCAKIDSIEDLSYVKPEGAVYLFINIKKTGMTASEFCDFALNKTNIAMLPGTCFGSNGEEYVRICFTREPETIVEAFDKLSYSLKERRADK